MNRTIALALAAALALTLAACAPAAEPAQDLFDPQTTLQALVDGGAFTEELEALDADVAFALYGLEGEGLESAALTDCRVLRSSGATCEEGAVLVFADEAQAQKGETALAAYLDAQREANRTYRPKELPKLDSAILERRGTTLLLVVAGDLDAVQAALG